jgi:hypothetical protein
MNHRFVQAVAFLSNVIKGPKFLKTPDFRRERPIFSQINALDELIKNDKTAKNVNELFIQMWIGETITSFYFGLPSNGQF